MKLICCLSQWYWSIGFRNSKGRILIGLLTSKNVSRQRHLSSFRTVQLIWRDIPSLKRQCLDLYYPSHERPRKISGDSLGKGNVISVYVNFSCTTEPLESAFLTWQNVIPRWPMGERYSLLFNFKLVPIFMYFLVIYVLPINFFSI